MQQELVQSLLVAVLRLIHDVRYSPLMLIYVL